MGTLGKGSLLVGMSCDEPLILGAQNMGVFEARLCSGCIFHDAMFAAAISEEQLIIHSGLIADMVSSFCSYIYS